MSKQQQREIATAFNSRVLAYIPGLTALTGSVTASIVLSQLIYWQDKSRLRDGWFYKTEKELYEETGITPKQQRIALNRLLALGVIEKAVKGIPGRRHFKVKVSLLLEYASAPGEAATWCN